MGKMQVRVTPSWDLPLLHKSPDSSAMGLDAPVSGGAGEALDKPQVIECLLNPAELLFLPVGWGLSVELLETSAAVSFGDLGFEGRVPGAESTGAKIADRFW